MPVAATIGGIATKFYVRMNPIKIELKYVNVSGFFPKNGLVELEVCFDDGKLKRFNKAIKAQDASGMTKAVVAAIENVKQSAYVEFDGRGFLETKVELELKDSLKIKRKLTKFFSDLIIRVNKVNKHKVADGYINAVNSVRSARVVL